MLHVTPRARNGQRAKVAAKGGWSQDGSKWDNKPTHTPVAHTCRMTYQPARGTVRDKTAAAARPFTPSPLSTQVQRRKPGPTRKKTETHNKAEAGKKCMSGRRVEERVKSNEAATGTRGSQRTSKGRAQGRGHGGHTASTTPHRDTGEGSTGGPREERHHAPRHTRHRHHTHRTHPTNPGNPPSSGRAVGRGTAPDPRRSSQWWKAPPPGTPFRHPHSEQRRPARAHAVGPVPGPHARTERARDTRAAEPWLPAPEDGRPGEGQRLTPGAPHNGGRHPPRGRPSATPTASNAGPQGRTLWGRCWVHTPASTAPGTHGSRNPGCPLQRTGSRGRDSA